MKGVMKLVVAGALAAWVGSAQAITQGACNPDVQKFCSDVQPGQGAVLKCLNSHKADLSPKCAGNVTEVKQTLKQVGNACEPDIETYCWNTPIGQGGIAGCLKQHSADLSPQCKAAVSKAKATKSQSQ
jgi:hypothetical protein